MRPLAKSKLALLLVSAGCLPGAGWAAPAAPAESQAASPATANIFADAIAFAQARCVKIYGAGIGRGYGYATGIIVSSDGRILTAQGVYLASERLRVVLPDGSLHFAQVERRSAGLQAALLKIDAATPDFFELPAEPRIAPGDWVVAVSNLYKVADGSELLSVNLGIASLRTKLETRRGSQEAPYDGELLLIDAITSNPGAPGGAVVDVEGRLVGMVGKVIESVDTGTKLNYAVPADLLRTLLDEEAAPVTTVVKPAGKLDLGFKIFTLGGKRAPAYIDRVAPGSVADKAGLQKDDLVLAVGRDVVHNVQDFQQATRDLPPGEEVVVQIKRGTEILTVRITPVSE